VNIFKKSEQYKDIGTIMQKYGGGGHRPVGACNVDIKEYKRIMDEIISELSSQ